MGEGEVTKWLSPETERNATQRARDRAKAATWDLDVAVFLFAVLIIVIILLFQGIGIGIVSPVAIFGLAMAWLVGWRRGQQIYQRFYAEELAKYPDDWKDYYKILHVSPSAESKDIIASYEHLSRIYDEALSDETKKIPLYSIMIKEINEAYQVLSDFTRRAAYDRVFWLKYNVDKGEIGDSDKYELVDLAQSISQDVLEAERRITWRIPLLSKVTRQVVIGVVIAVFSILFGGTSLAFAKPEHTLATPFKGIAVTLTRVSAGAIGLIEDVPWNSSNT
ncbi:J domain-containing protein [Chloroflexota bacterium]